MFYWIYRLSLSERSFRYLSMPSDESEPSDESSALDCMKKLPPERCCGAKEWRPPPDLFNYICSWSYYSLRNYRCLLIFRIIRLRCELLLSKSYLDLWTTWVYEMRRMYLRRACGCVKLFLALLLFSSSLSLKGPLVLTKLTNLSHIFFGFWASSSSFLLYSSFSSSYLVRG